MSRDFRDDVIEALADSEAVLRDEVSHLRDLVAGYQLVSSRLLARLYALEGDDIRGYWEALDGDVDRGLHPPPRSIVARLKRTIRHLHAALRDVREKQRAAA